MGHKNRHLVPTSPFQMAKFTVPVKALEPTFALFEWENFVGLYSLFAAYKALHMVNANVGSNAYTGTVRRGTTI